jgi:hypothetical protein
MARKATASVKTEINGYGWPQNATDESESTGLRGAAVGGKRKPRANAAATKDERAKIATAVVTTVSATPASSTGGSSSEGELHSRRVAASLVVQVALPWLDGRGTVIAVAAAAAAKRANQSAKDSQEEEFRDLMAPSPQEIHLRLGPTPNRGRAILLINLQFLY